MKKNSDLGVLDGDDGFEGFLEDLVVECVARVEDTGQAALDELLGEHPEHAPELRRRVEALRRIGLIGDPAPATPRRLGDFTLHDRLGGGGMGIVYRATQSGIGRDVALKIVRPDLLHVEGTRARFRREVEAVGLLSHAGIVPVFAVGEQDGVPYLAMERVVGATLAEVLGAVQGRDPATLTGRDLGAAVGSTSGAAAQVDLAAPPFRGTWVQACASIGVVIGEALEHAHRAGILHRDVKPSNVLLGVDGRARLFDFGLALPAEADALTRTGAVVGSLPYMAPEQADGGTVDRRTDVYGLGATLYELCTLGPPFPERHPGALRAAILRGDSVSARKQNRAVPRDLALVLARALDRDPGRRYAGAGDLARDLANVLAGRPIDARPPSPLTVARRFARRRPALVAGLLVGSIAAVGTPTVVAVQQRNANARITAALDAERAEHARAEANANLALAALHDVVGALGNSITYDLAGPWDRTSTLLERAAHKYDGLLSQGVGTPGSYHGRLQRQTAKALLEIGRDADARATNAKAAGPFREQLASGRRTYGPLLDLADVLLVDARLRIRAGEYAEALALGAESDALITELLEGRVEAHISQRVRTRALVLRRRVRQASAVALWSSGRVDEASAEIDRALADSTTLSVEDPLYGVFELLDTRELRARLALEQGRFDDAAAELFAVFAEAESLYADSVATRELDLVARAAGDLSRALWRSGRTDEIEPIGAAGLAAVRQLKRLHPIHPSGVERLAALAGPFAAAQIEAGRKDEARALLAEASAELDRLCAERPDNRELAVLRADARRDAAELLLALELRDGARVHAAAAVDDYERLLAAGVEGVRPSAEHARKTLAILDAR